MSTLTQAAKLVQQRFDQLDTNHDHTIDFGEFANLKLGADTDREDLFQQLVAQTNDQTGPETSVFLTDIEQALRGTEIQGVDYLPEPKLGSTPLGLGASQSLIESRDRQLSDEQYQIQLDRINQLATDLIPSMAGRTSIEFPALGRSVVLEDGAYHHSFDAISQERLDEMKLAIRLATGYEGEIKLNLPTRNQPRQDYQHLIIESADREPIGVVKFTEPVSIKFIPSALPRD